MNEYILESLKPKVRVVTKQKKRKRWIAETAYLTAEGATEDEALANLVAELRMLAHSIEEMLEKK